MEQSGTLTHSNFVASFSAFMAALRRNIGKITNSHGSQSEIWLPRNGLSLFVFPHMGETRLSAPQANTMQLDTYILFFVTTLVICFTPGAAAITVASQGAANGGRRALFGAAGVVWGNVIYFVLSATGIASLIIASHTLFSVIKWVGVAYLIFLGAYAIFSKSGAIKVGADKKKSRYRTMFIKGFIIELANPKALLYFAAVLPQFLDTSSPIAIQFLIMGVTTFFLDCLAYGSYAFLGDRLTRGGMKEWVVSAVNKTAGTALIFAGIKMATVSANN